MGEQSPKSRISTGSLIGVGFVALLLSTTPLFAQCTDRDADGFGRPGDASCPAGAQQDCNDRAASTNPNAAEICDGLDNDCNESVDDDPSCHRTLVGADRIGTDTILSEFPNSDDYVTYPTLAWTGTNYGALWSQREYGVASGLMFQRLDAQGQSLGADPIPLVDHGTSHGQIVWSGTEYGTTWKDGVAPYPALFMLVDSAGIPSGPEVDLGCGASRARAVWNGEIYGVLCHNSDAATLTFNRVDSEGGAETAVPLGITGVVSNPAMAWDGEYFGVAIARTENAGANIDYVFLRLDEWGAQVGDAEIIDPNVSGGLYSVSLVWTGTEYGFWWDNGSTVMFTRLSSTGQTIGNQVDVTAGDTWGERLTMAAWTGEEYGLLFRSQILFPQSDLNLRFARVSPVGELLGARIKLSANHSAMGSDYNGYLVWTGADFGIVWWEADMGFNKALMARIGVDADGDDYALGRDCDDATSDLWAPPSEVNDLLFQPDNETLDWLEPGSPGSSLPLRYDVLRSGDAADFGASALCVESGDGPNTTAVDTEIPLTGDAFFYLVRAENDCPDGSGTLGTGRGGTERVGRSCP